MLKEIQEKYKMFYNDDFLNNILQNGAKKAQKVANETLTRAKSKLGLN